MGVSECLERVETIVRGRGYVNAHAPHASSDDIAEAERRLGTNIPLDLRTLLLWHDPALWSWFVNPSRERLSDRHSLDKNWKRITPDHPDDRIVDDLRLAHPSQLMLHVPSDENCEDCMLRETFVEVDVPGGLFSPEAADARLLQFGAASSEVYGLYYCLDAMDGRPEGAIAVTVTDNPCLLFVAESLAQWLEFLLELGGTELMIYTGELDSLPMMKRRRRRRLFKRLNPHSEFIG